MSPSVHGALRRCVSCVFILPLGAMLAPSGCGEVVEDDGTSAWSVTACWDPGFSTKSCLQSAWWMEFAVKDTTTTAMTVEIAGNPPRTLTLPNRVPLGGGTVKFTGGTDGAIATGTQLRLHATTSGGAKTAQSLWFGYRKTAPAIDCSGVADAGADSGALDSGTDATVDSGVLDSGLDATVDSGAIADSGAIDSGAVVDSGVIDSGVPDSGAIADSGIVDSGVVDAGCARSCANKVCGDDGCGGSCGTCGQGLTCSAGACVGGCVAPWSPVWQQTSSSGSWWAEFQVFGGGSTARSVAFEVVGGTTTPLANDYGRWTSGLTGVASGTLVVLHATDATGATAQTVPFKYLVDKAPATDACKGTPSALPTCKPLARGMVTFTMDDSNESQWTVAAPLLAKYGYKATIHHITDQLSSYALLPMAQSLAAAGHEVASHSKSHPFLTGLTAAQLDDELRLSQQYLVANVGSPVESFASPMGAYDANVLTAIKKVYKSHRTVNVGQNYMGSSVYELSADGVYNDSTPASVCTMLAETAVYRGWRVLVFHDFTNAASSSYALSYPAASFEAILKCAQATVGLDVVTTRQGVAAIACASP